MVRIPNTFTRGKLKISANISKQGERDLHVGHAGCNILPDLSKALLAI